MRRRVFGSLMLLIAVGLSSCGGSALVAYDLRAITPASNKAPRQTLRIRESSAGPDLDGDRILVRNGASLSVLRGAAWADRLPLLIQARLLQSFQNGRGLRAVGEGAGDYSADLQTQLRAFELDEVRRVVRIDIVAKIATPGGHVLAARIFRAEAPVDSTDPAAVAAALDGALSHVLRNIVDFASR